MHQTTVAKLHTSMSSRDIPRFLSVNLTDSRRLHLLETFPKFVPAPVPEASRQQNKICVVSIFYSCLGWCLCSEFSRQAHPTAESLTNDCKSMIRVFGFFYSHAPGIVVTAWWESTHVLIPIGFLSWRWLESLLFITDVCFFLFWVEKKMILHLTILVCIYDGSTTERQNPHHLSFVPCYAIGAHATARAPETRYGIYCEWKNTQE